MGIITARGQLDDFLGRLFENYLFRRHRGIRLPEDMLWWEMNRFKFSFKDFEISVNVVLELITILQDWGIPRNMLLVEINVLQEYLNYFLVKNIGLWVI